MYQATYDFLKGIGLTSRAVYGYFSKAKIRNDGFSRCASMKVAEKADDDTITKFMYDYVKSGEEFGTFATDYGLNEGHKRPKLYGWKKRYEEHIKVDDLQFPFFMPNYMDPRALNSIFSSSEGKNL